MWVKNMNALVEDCVEGCFGGFVERFTFLSYGVLDVLKQLKVNLVVFLKAEMRETFRMR